MPTHYQVINNLIADRDALYAMLDKAQRWMTPLSHPADARGTPHEYFALIEDIEAVLSLWRGARADALAELTRMSDEMGLYDLPATEPAQEG